MEEILIFFLGAVAGGLLLCICKSGAIGSAISGANGDNDRARELKQRAESDIEQAKRDVASAESDNRELREGCDRTAELIKRGKEILEEANNSNEHD